MTKTTILDLEFVVVDPDINTQIVPHTVPTPTPYCTPFDNILSIEEARTRLAKLLRYPLTSIHIIDQVGRAYLLQYEPAKRNDPDIILCTWPSAKPINRLILELQKARAVAAWRDPAEFWADINYYAKRLKKLTAKSKSITAEERTFVLRWAYRIRDTFATIPQHQPQPEPYDYWGW